MKEYRISLEQEAINAFIRRKAGYMLKAMSTLEYMPAARKAIGDIGGCLTSCRLQPGMDNAVIKAAEALMEKLEDTITGDVERYATQYAYQFYISPQEFREEHENLKSMLVAAPENAERLGKAGAAKLAAILENYTAVNAAAAVAAVKGTGFALAKQSMDTAIRAAYPNRESFLAKENQITKAMEDYVSAMTAANMEDAEPWEVYASLMADILQGVVSWIQGKSSEIEADEVYDKA